MSIALRTQKLTRGTGRHILTLITLLAARDVDILEGPVGAAAFTAENVHGHSIIADRAGHTVDSDIGDLDIVTGLASRAAVLVVLLDDDAVVGDSGQLDVGVGDVADGAGLVDNGFDAHAVRRVADGRVVDSDILHSVVVTATNGADGQAVATGARTARELDVLARVDGDAVVLVLDSGTGDVHAVALADVECVGVVAAVVITARVVDGEVLEMQVVGLHADGLDRCVLDVEAGDLRVLQLMGVHELGLLLAAIGALAVPPSRALTVNHGVFGGSDGDVGSLKTDQRTLPFLVAEGGGAFEGDLGAVLDVGQVKCLTGRHLDVLQYDIGTRRGALGGSRSVREGTAVSFDKFRSTRRRRRSRNNRA